jgi:predicted ArsR family transcriptional regulator
LRKLPKTWPKNLHSDAQAENMTIEQRLELVKMALHKEGFNIEWELQGDQYHIREISCPYYFVGQNHPEVCAVDQIFISTILSAPAEKTKCILNGDTHCTYVVPDPASVEK